MNASAILVTLLLAVIISSTAISASSTSGSLVIKGFPQKSPLEAGEVPVIIGRVTDNSGKPVADVSITAVVGDNHATTISNKDGSFKISLAPTTSGKQYTNVIATKDGFDETSVIVSYNVKESPLIPQLSPPDLSGVKTLVQDGLTKNPLSEYLIKQMDASRSSQEETQKQQQTIDDNNHKYDEQRKLVDEKLQKDLSALDAETTIKSARKAFEAFVADMDAYVQGIFLDQFGFTEQKSNEGREAKMKALEDGVSSKEATKIFQKKAAVSRSDVINYNTYLNVKHGFTNPSSQTDFDNEGKLPRQKNNSTE